MRLTKLNILFCGLVTFLALVLSLGSWEYYHWDRSELVNKELDTQVGRDFKFQQGNFGEWLKYFLDHLHERDSDNRKIKIKMAKGIDPMATTLHPIERTLTGNETYQQLINYAAYQYGDSYIVSTRGWSITIDHRTPDFMREQGPTEKWFSEVEKSTEKGRQTLHSLFLRMRNKP